MNKKAVWWIGTAVVLVGIVVAVAVWPKGSPDSDDAAIAFSLDYASFHTAGMTIGNPDAPVLVEEYFDFQCPHCQTASEQIVKPLIDTYVRSGDVRFAYRFYPFMGSESVAAAEASFCAAMQGAFWPYQEILFDQKGTGDRGTYSRDRLIAYANEAGLDEATFVDCLDSDDARIYVRGSYDLAVQRGIGGTPTFVVNGRAVSASLDAIGRAIDAALEAASN